MAYIDKSGVRSITEHFENLGFPIQFFNPTTDERIDAEGELQYFIEEPIKLLSTYNGDEYLLYYKTNDSWNFRNVKKDENNNLIVDESKASSWNQGKFILKKVKSGGKFLSDEEVDTLAQDEEYIGRINEFSNLENFNSIDAPDYSVIFGDNPQVSVASPIVNIEEITDSQFKDAQKLLEEQEQTWLETKKAQNEGVLQTAMWTFDEVDKLYNSKITSDDKRAYFIYLQNKCGKKLTGDWDAKYGSSYPAEAVDILELMKKGRLFVDLTANRGERLQPRVIFRSGNIWKKHASLTNRKEEYIKRFGEEIYNLHVKEINEVFQIVWQNRLRVSGSDNSVMLKMLPISEMANEFRISKILSPKNRDEILQNFQVYTSFKKGERIEDIAGIGEGTARLNYITKSSLTLKEGFIKWCSEAGSGVQALEHSIQWSSSTPNIEILIDRYLKPISNPYGEKGKDKWEREKDDARKVGERLFAQFLKVGVEASDQTKIEAVWNSIYNAYHEPILEEVPIGFTYKKYLDDRDLFKLKESNLNALRYFMSRGSVGLAYGVGLGKTFCSIFVMKQALDLGICKRPLVIVPNQVYFQFSQEIKRGLGSDFDGQVPDSRLNMFYNGTGFYNRLGNKAVDGINLCTYEATENFVFDKNQKDDEWVDEAINILEMGGDIINPIIRTEWKKSYSGSIFGDLETISDLNEVDTTIELTDGTSDNDIDLGDFGEGGKLKEGKAEEKQRAKKQIEPIYINTEDTMYDFVCVDEAHNFNNLFTQVIASPKDIQKGEASKKTGKIKVQRETNPYSKIRETGGGKEASARATKLFWITRYIQNYNSFGNTLLLSATPFTNSPLQVFTMCSFLNYDILFDMQIGVIKDFFDLFAKIEYAEDFRTDLTIVKRNKFIGWSNAIALQKLVYRYFDKSTREQEDKAVVRPQKISLPLKRMLINGKTYELAKENFVSTTIKMSELQLTLWRKIQQYAEGTLPYEQLCNEETSNTTSLGKYVPPKTKKEEDDKDSTDGGEIDITDPTDLADGTEEGKKSHAGVRRLQCLMWGRQLALNPYLFKCSGFKEEPTGKEYVEASPKLLYAMNCIASVKEYHANSTTSPYMSGQIIYMNFGIDAFPLLRDYLVDEVGFKLDEIGIIAGSGNYIGKKKYENKQDVADAFIGRILDAEKGTYTRLSEEKRVKVLIGSESIKEGINLQEYSSVLYNCFLDFNPTDRIQLEGRLWRQGNKFANVRIVTPLMADCIDVFMFQKLEDKTERINQIWTRNGQINELDTTSFDPAELKYELLTDPSKIAMLEIENKKERLEEKKTDEVGILSDYINLENAWNRGDKSIYPPLNSNTANDFRGYMYYIINQIRPDLIDKPLLNKDETAKWQKSLYDWAIKKGDTSVNNSFVEGNNFYQILDNRYYNYESSNPYYIDMQDYYKYPSQLVQLEKIFNYTAEELINLMVQVTKEQKIGFPRGYSKNWREVKSANIEVPIVEGDEVEFDTKKGRKKGKAELVMADNRQMVLANFFYHLMFQYKNNDTDNKNINDAIKELKLKLVNFENDNFNEVNDDPKIKSEWIILLKHFYKTNPNNIMNGSSGEFASAFIPVVLDIDEFEDVNIAEKNVVRVKTKDELGKEVKPTKYPEPYTFTNKEAKENLIDSIEFLKAQNVYSKSDDYDIRNSYESYNWLGNELTKNVEEQQTFTTNGIIQSISSIILPFSSSYNQFQVYFDTTEEITKYVNDNYPKSWVELESLWNDKKVYGLFTNMYSFEIPRNIADFKQMKEKKFAQLGINTRTDLNNLLTSQREVISGIDIEKNNLDDPQVIQEEIQEVQRRMDELNNEEIRAGSSFVARAKTFATCNPEYLGNEMLSIFMNTPNKETIKCGHDYSQVAELVEEIIETPIEIVETPTEEVVTTAKTTQELIDELEMLMEFESAKEKKKTQKIIDDLRMLMEFE